MLQILNQSQSAVLTGARNLVVICPCDFRRSPKSDAQQTRQIKERSKNEARVVPEWQQLVQEVSRQQHNTQPRRSSRVRKITDGDDRSVVCARTARNNGARYSWCQTIVIRYAHYIVSDPFFPAHTVKRQKNHRGKK